MIPVTSYISASAENLYKFLFINGTILVILSMFYPMQQENEINLKRIDYNQKVDLLNYEIANQKTIVDGLTKNSHSIIKVLDSLSIINTDNNESTIQKIKFGFNKALDSIKNSKRKIDVNTIKIKNEKEKIEVLLAQASKYRNYSTYFLLAGIVFFLVGLIGWSKATKTLDKIKNEELERLKRENQESS